MRSTELFDAYGRSPDSLFSSPAIDTAAEFPLERGSSGMNSSRQPPPYYVGFDRGFVIRPMNKNESPFELKINSQSQIRYTDFNRDVATWTDGAGNVSPVSDVNSFQIPRGRIIFSGCAFKPELTYNLNIDYNTVSNRQINFRAYWLAWRFSRAMTVYAGQSKVPGGREWLASFVNTLGPDRSMATTFFRPSLSQGVWATGEPADGLFYHVMMSNGFNTLGTTTNQLNAKMSFSGSVWWEPWGDFGAGYSDWCQRYVFSRAWATGKSQPPGELGSSLFRRDFDHTNRGSGTRNHVEYIHSRTHGIRFLV
jgi:hypothetical protein